MSELKPLPKIEDFLLQCPLYDEYEVSEGCEELFKIYNQAGDLGIVKIDGYCPYCQKSTTYAVSPIREVADNKIILSDKRHIFDNLYIRCARSGAHFIVFNLHIHKSKIKKIGQWPSLADIANDESKRYRSVLSRVDGAEFHRAIGLASHGVGIGAFVYLRRIFERLIHQAFRDHQQVEGWSDTDFTSKRMEDKIELLKGHLPQFLVEQKRIYSILSVGIHELDEKECLGFFEALKHSIIIILEDHKRQKEERERRDQFAKAIAGFQPKKAGGDAL